MYKELDYISNLTREELEEKYCKLYKNYKILDIQFNNKECELNDRIDNLTTDLPRQTTILLIGYIKKAGLYNDELDDLFNEFCRYELHENSLII